MKKATIKIAVPTRPLAEIVKDIRSDWGKKMYFGAVPYFKAMESLNSIDENYFFDSGDSVVRYFLSNASTWRGETAKKCKAELKAMLKK